MIPLRDENPTRSFAFVTLTLIVINVLVFLREITLVDVRVFFEQYALFPQRVSQAGSPKDYLPVLTSMFLHGGWMHLIGNMWFFWIFGNNIEDAVGHFKFIVFYLLCGAAAAAAQIAINPDSAIPMLGASGAVSGILGAYVVLFPRARVLIAFPIWIFVRLFYVPAILMLAVWFGLQLVSGWLTKSDQGGGVAFWAHIGGFIAGLVLIPLFKKRRVRLFQ